MVSLVKPQITRIGGFGSGQPRKKNNNVPLQKANLELSLNNVSIKNVDSLFN